LAYTEIGDLNLSIKDSDNIPYAIVDKYDSVNPNGYIIEPSNTLITFIPAYYDISGNFNNYKNYSFTYVSNDLNMSALLNFKIVPKSLTGNDLLNFNKNCYAKDINTTINYSVPSFVPKIYFLDEYNSKKDMVDNKGIYLFKISKNEWISNQLDKEIKINVLRYYNSYYYPFEFLIKDVNVTDGKTTGNLTLNKKANFKYGAFFIKNGNNKSLYNNKANITIEYKICNNSGLFELNTEHSSSIFGDINLSKSTYEKKYISITKNPIKNGTELLNISSTLVPYGAKIHFSIPSWLWYNPLAKEYKSPLISLDCLTHPCMKIVFQKPNSKWVGIGNPNSKYAPEKRLPEIEINSTTPVDTESVKKIFW
ncbi:hypothetical protein, partial [Caminibacter mediatlanticus]